MNVGLSLQGGWTTTPIAGGQTRMDRRGLALSRHGHTPVTTFSEARLPYLEGSHLPCPPESWRQETLWP